MGHIGDIRGPKFHSHTEGLLIALIRNLTTRGKLSYRLKEGVTFLVIYTFFAPINTAMPPPTCQTFLCHHHDFPVAMVTFLSRSAMRSPSAWPWGRKWYHDNLISSFMTVCTTRGVVHHFSARGQLYDAGNRLTAFCSNAN